MKFSSHKKKKIDIIIVYSLEGEKKERCTTAGGSRGRAREHLDEWQPLTQMATSMRAAMASNNEVAWPWWHWMERGRILGF